MNVAKFKVLVIGSIFLVAACGKSAPHQPSAKVLDIADQYCNEIAKPWFALAEACRSEQKAGGEGKNCSDLNDLMAEIKRRQEATNFKTCQMPSPRIGHAFK